MVTSRDVSLPLAPGLGQLDDHVNFQELPNNQLDSPCNNSGARTLLLASPKLWHDSIFIKILLVPLVKPIDVCPTTMGSCYYGRGKGLKGGIHVTRDRIGNMLRKGFLAPHGPWVAYIYQIRTSTLKFESRGACASQSISMEPPYQWFVLHVVNLVLCVDLDVLAFEGSWFNQFRQCTLSLVGVLSCS